VSCLPLDQDRQCRHQSWRECLLALRRLRRSLERCPPQHAV